MKTKYFLTFLISLILFTNISCKKNNDETLNYNYSAVVPTRGNSWVLNNIDKTRQIIGNNGIHNWTDNSLKIRTYFKTTQTGELNIGISAKAENGESKIKVTFNGESQTVKIGNQLTDTIHIGNFEMEKTGYHFIESKIS
ncbi:MAG: DUF5077 domain-containing protein [Tangfeifania sp.]